MQASAPELRLLLASARVRSREKNDVAIRQLLNDGIDWTCFAREAVRHGLAPLAGQTLIRIAPDLVPEEILKAFQTAIVQTTQRNLLLFGELADMADELADSGIETIPFRGPLLPIQAFGDMGFRAADSLNLLIRAPDAAAAAAALRSMGYEHKEAPASGPELRRQGQESLYRPVLDTTAVLHTQLAPELALDMDLGGLWRRSRETVLNGRSIRTLAPEDEVVLLAVHAGSRAWRRMTWACDAAGLLETHQQLDWAAAIERARAQGCLRMLLLATSLARTCFDAGQADTILAAERADPAIQPMAARIWANWQTDAPVEPGIAERLRLHDGFWNRARYAARLLRATPSPLGLLYRPRHPAPLSTSVAPKSTPLQKVADLLVAPDLFPLKMNERDQTLLFIPMSRETYHQSPFLDRRAISSGPGQFSAGLAQLRPLASASRAERPVHYILHGAMCGSTLMARYLEELPHCLVLKEPEFFGQLARLRIDASGPAPFGPDLWADWFKIATTLFSRGYPADTSVVIKPTDLCNWMGDVLLDHDERTKIVFLVGPLRQFLTSVLKSSRRREWIHGRMRVLKGCLAQVPLLEEAATAELNDGQCAGAIWLYNNFLGASWLKRPDAGRILPLSSANFFADPISTVRSVADFLGLTGDEAVRKALTDMSLLSRHSKYQDVPYSATRRDSFLGAAGLKFREEIEAALTWTQQVSAKAQLRMPFPIE
jgi:hypothetical protein